MAHMISIYAYHMSCSTCHQCMPSPRHCPGPCNACMRAFTYILLAGSVANQCHGVNQRTRAAALSTKRPESVPPSRPPSALRITRLQ